MGFKPSVLGPKHDRTTGGTSARSDQDALDLIETDFIVAAVGEATAQYYVKVFGATSVNKVETGGAVRVIVSLAGLNLFIEQVAPGTPAPPQPPHLELEHIGLAVTNIGEVRGVGPGAADAHIGRTERGGELAQPGVGEVEGRPLSFMPDGVCPLEAAGVGPADGARSRAPGRKVSRTFRR